MQAQVKKSFEYAVITLLVCGFCLWQLNSSTDRKSTRLNSSH